MVKKTVEERIKKKKSEIEQLQKRIDADNQRLRKLKGELDALEMSQVKALLEDFNMSPDQLKMLLKRQNNTNFPPNNSMQQEHQQ